MSSSVNSGEYADGSIEFPFASLEEAKGEIMKLSSRHIFSKDHEYLVNVLDGDYYLKSTFLFDDSDRNNLQNESVVFKGESKENTRIKGSTLLDNRQFTKVDDDATLARVPLEAREKLYKINLLEYGYVDEPENAKFELTINDNMGTAARYPNDNGVLSSTDYMKTGTVSGDGLGFLYTDTRALRWTSATDMYVDGMFSVDYFENAYPANVNIDTGEIRVETTSGDAISTGKNFYVYNLLEELDVPNEYFYDKTNGNLYVYADNINDLSFEIQKDHGNLIQLNNGNNIQFSNMTLCNNYGTVINITGGSGNKIENCIIKNGTANAVRISGETANKNGIINCEIYDMGTGGISLGGGDRKTLISGENYALNNAIHDFQRINRSYKAGISLSGVANKAINNEVYNAYHLAISFYGNDLMIENNEVYNVCMETTDMGALYAEGDWTLRGNQINHNYLHNIPRLSSIGPQAIYLDNGTSGTTVTNNVFENIGSHGVYINGGRDNIITNNIFVDNENNLSNDAAVVVSDILNWSGSLQAQANVKSSMLEKLLAVPYNSEVYDKYPNLANILSDEPVLPKYNRISGNLIVNLGQIKTTWLRTVTMAQLVESYGCELNNAVYTQDPGFTDMANKDYTLKSTSDVFVLFPNFKQISMSNFGIQNQ